jgi:hypothetical protein
MEYFHDYFLRPHAAEALAEAARQESYLIKLMYDSIFYPSVFQIYKLKATFPKLGKKFKRDWNSKLIMRY